MSYILSGDLFAYLYDSPKSYIMIKSKMNFEVIMDYDLLVSQIRSLGDACSWYCSVFSNASALLFETLPDLNWAGFYIVSGEELLLGPFQGKVACVRIPFGKGVCGTAVAERRTVLVDNVHEFPGHIACDSASNSELVIPIYLRDVPFAVLDLDSPLFSRFSEHDREGLERFVKALEEIITV